jgi:hypothetical protein
MHLSGQGEVEALRRAMVPWTELIGRDPLDPAVQEGMVSIAYALERCGAHEQAKQYYLRAIRDLQLTYDRLGDALQSVSSGRMLEMLASGGRETEGDWPWWFVDLPKGGWWRYGLPDVPTPAPETFYFEHLFADPGFVEALSAFSGPGAIESASDSQRQRLQSLALAELGRERHQAEGYLVEARFELARIYDPPPAEDEP